MSSKTALIVFAREPRLGRVKTRLARDLGAELALELYQGLVEDVLAVAGRTAAAGRFIYAADLEPAGSFFARWQAGFAVVAQTGADLGARMDAAFREVVGAGFDRVILIGSDCPDLTPAILADAAQRLTDHDLVLGPAADGGYYLIGLNRPRPALFAGVDWGTDRVLAQTAARAKALGLRTSLLAERQDIDTLADLRAYARRVQADGAEPGRKTAGIVLANPGGLFYT